VNQRAHLLEETLFDCYLADRQGERIDPPTAEHLADCPACAARYADLAGFMDDLRSDAVNEADGIFTADHLRAQQQQIARRLAHVGRPARVILFPGRFVRRTMANPATHSAPRWVAAAAAAGLFVGIAVGASYQFSGRFNSWRTMARQTSPAAVATRGQNPAEVAADDAFLSDLEVALQRPHTRELVAFEAFTPHVREVHEPR